MKLISTEPNPPTVTQTTESTAKLQEQVRCRAYEIYEQRGREEGHDLDDWLQAESELVHQRTKAVAA
jgi:Protein of unknown function (DUF2934)